MAAEDLEELLAKLRDDSQPYAYRVGIAQSTVEHVIGLLKGVGP